MEAHPPSSFPKFNRMQQIQENTLARLASLQSDDQFMDVGFFGFDNSSYISKCIEKNEFCFICRPGKVVVPDWQPRPIRGSSLPKDLAARWQKYIRILLKNKRNWEGYFEKYSTDPLSNFKGIFTHLINEVVLNIEEISLMKKYFINNGGVEAYYWPVERELQSFNSLIHVAHKRRFLVVLEVVLKFVHYIDTHDTDNFNITQELKSSIKPLSLPSGLQLIHKSELGHRNFLKGALKEALDDIKEEEGEFPCNIDNKDLLNPHSFCRTNCQRSRCIKKKTTIDKSITGWGLFALEAISAGEYIEDICGVLSERIHTSPYIIKYDSFSINATKKASIGRFVNHSCRPNSQFIKSQIVDLPAILIQALRDINPNEEIKVNYGDQLWFTCNCGVPECVGLKK